MSRLSRLVLTSLVSLFAVSGLAGAQDVTPTTEAPSSDAGFHLSRYQGPGFSLLIPFNAGVRVEGNKTIIFGPIVEYIDPVNRSHTKAYAYALTVTVRDNRREVSAETYARDEIAIMYAWIHAHDAPLGGIPVDEDGDIREDQVQRLTLGGEPAFDVRFFGFDSIDDHFYVARGNKVYVIVYDDNSFDHDPLAPFQLDFYALMLSTIQFDR